MISKSYFQTSAIAIAVLTRWGTTIPPRIMEWDVCDFEVADFDVGAFPLDSDVGESVVEDIVGEVDFQRWLHSLLPLG